MVRHALFVSFVGWLVVWPLQTNGDAQQKETPVVQIPRLGCRRFRRSRGSSSAVRTTGKANVKFQNSLVRVPFRILTTNDEEKLLSKNYKSIERLVKEAFQPKKK